MVWAKLDDEILDNEKIAAAGVLGFAFHVAAITWCCRNLTDGFVPRGRVRCLLDTTTLIGELADAVTPNGHDADRIIESTLDLPDPDALRIASKLVSIGLWSKDEERVGYWLNDFLTFNPSREDVLKKRDKEREKKTGQRASSPPRNPNPSVDMSPGDSPGESESCPMGIPSSPVPVPLRVKSTVVDLGTAQTPPPDKPKRKKPVVHRNPETFVPSSDAPPDEVRQWAEKWEIPQVHEEFQLFLDGHRKKESRWRDWGAAWRTWLSNAKKFTASRPSGTYRKADIIQRAPEGGSLWKIGEVIE